ncbi:MAG: hypothetical protein ACOC2N_07070 [Spirochaetota bacterium]
MTKDDLIREAAALPAPAAEAAAEYEEKSDAIASELNSVMAARPDLEVLVNTVLWVFRAYRAHGFNLTYWPAQLDTWVVLLEKHLSPSSFAAIYPVYHFMLIHQPDFVGLSDEALAPHRDGR